MPKSIFRMFVGVFSVTIVITGRYTHPVFDYVEQLLESDDSESGEVYLRIRPIDRVFYALNWLGGLRPRRNVGSFGAGLAAGRPFLFFLDSSARN